MEIFASITTLIFTLFLLFSFASVLFPFNNIFSLRRRVEKEQEVKTPLEKKGISIW